MNCSGHLRRCRYVTGRRLDARRVKTHITKAAVRPGAERERVPYLKRCQTATATKRLLDTGSDDAHAKMAEDHDAKRLRSDPEKNDAIRAVIRFRAEARSSR